MSDEWKHNRASYLKYKCRCEICVADARLYRENRRAQEIRLDAELLIHRLTLDGRITSIGSSLVSKWRKFGMNVYNADRWAVKLGYHPYEIWGDDFYQGCDDYVKG